MCYLFDFFPLLILNSSVTRESVAITVTFWQGQAADAKTTQTGGVLCQDWGHPFTSSMAVITNWLIAMGCLCPEWQRTLYPSGALAVFSCWCSVSVFVVVCLSCSGVCLCPWISHRLELRFGCLSITYICFSYTDKIHDTLKQSPVMVTC